MIDENVEIRAGKSARNADWPAVFVCDRGKVSVFSVSIISKVRNKMKQQELYRNSRIQKSKSRITLRKERAQSEKLDPTRSSRRYKFTIFCPMLMIQERLKTNIPATLENKREYDETIIQDLQDWDLVSDLTTDEFASFFVDASAKPKLLMTTSHHPLWLLMPLLPTFSTSSQTRPSDLVDVHTCHSKNWPLEPLKEDSRTCSSSTKKKRARKLMR